MVINKNPIENLKTKQKKEVGLVLVKLSAILKALRMRVSEAKQKISIKRPQTVFSLRKRGLNKVHLLILLF